MNNFWDNIRINFTKGSTLMQLLYINIGVFIICSLSNIILKLFNIDANNIYSFIETYSNLEILAQRPWTIITYMFMHLDLMHIFFNMLCLWWFGKIFLQYLSEKQLVGIYIISGIAGALTFVAAYNIFPYFEHELAQARLLGASGAVTGIMFTAATMAPTYKVRLFLIGEVKLRTLAFVMLLVSLINLTSDNAGGEFAHLGGAIMGYIYALLLRRGKDISAPITWTINKVKNVFKPRPKIKVHKYNTGSNAKTDAEYNQERQQANKTIDLILDKIKQSGYASLSETEKKQLFDNSNKI